jgi:RimJ/RimL family protein N-acetyltransferase
MVQLWNLEQLSRHAQVTALLPEEFQGAGWPLEGVALCVDYGFRAFDLRKIYLETLSSELATFRSLLGGLLQEEGRLRGHQFVFGEFVDLHVIAIYREGFDAVFQQLLPAGVS